MSGSNAPTAPTAGPARLPRSAAEYRASLDAAWAQHTAPRTPDAPTVASLFAGCGGSSLGYSMAGYREVLAVEWSQPQATIFRANFPEVPVYQGDITSLTDADALQMAGLKPGHLDVLDGSPPCQGMSMAGQRVLDDPRNDLFRQFVRLLHAFQPRALVMENVDGMVRGKMKIVFLTILQALDTAGYTVAARVLNAVRYGVPQSRKRIIFVGLRKDLGLTPSHPVGLPGIPITAQMAVRGAPIDEAERLWLLEAGLKYQSYRHWSAIPPGGAEPDVTGGTSNWSGCKIHPGKPAPTITRSTGNIGLPQSMHWAERRRCTLAEFARLGSFPDAFLWPGGWKAGVEGVGNCVPPLFARAIAAHVRTLLETSP